MLVDIYLSTLPTVPPAGLVASHLHHPAAVPNAILKFLLRRFQLDTAIIWGQSMGALPQSGCFSAVFGAMDPPVANVFAAWRSKLTSKL